MVNKYLNTSIGTFWLEQKGKIIPFKILRRTQTVFQKVDLAVYIEPEIPSNCPVDEICLSSDIKSCNWKLEDTLSGENLWGGDFLNYENFYSLSIGMVSDMTLNKFYVDDVIYPMYKLDESKNDRVFMPQNFKYTEIDPKVFIEFNNTFGFGIAIKKYANIQSLRYEETSLATFYLL